MFGLSILLILEDCISDSCHTLTPTHNYFVFRISVPHWAWNWRDWKRRRTDDDVYLCLNFSAKAKRKWVKSSLADSIIITTDWNLIPFNRQRSPLLTDLWWGVNSQCWSTAPQLVEKGGVQSDSDHFIKSVFQRSYFLKRKNSRPLRVAGKCASS